MRKEKVIEAIEDWISSRNECESQNVSNGEVSILEQDEVVNNGEKFFLVNFKMNSSNDILIEIESEIGNVSIKDCVSLTKFIESKFDREIEDYSLEVGSAGIGQPFKVLKQYLISIGQKVEVSSKDGKKIVGVLTDANDKEFKIETSMKIKVEGAKKPTIQEVEVTYTYDEVNEVRLQIDFKSRK